MMGHPCVRLAGRFLASYDDKAGCLVVKLPRERVTELVENGQGDPFAPAGKVFREWVSIPTVDREPVADGARGGRRLRTGGADLITERRTSSSDGWLDAMTTPPKAHTSPAPLLRRTLPPGTPEKHRADMWLPPDQDPRTEGNPQGEKATYVEYLTNYRLTLGMKCDGLTPEQLATRIRPAVHDEPARADPAHGPGRAQLVPAVAAGPPDGPDLLVRRGPRPRLQRGRRRPRTWWTTRSRPGGADRRGRRVAGRRPESDLGAMVPIAARRRGRSVRDILISHDRGVRPALRPRRPAARVHRRAHRPVSAATDELATLRRWLADLRATVERKSEGLSPAAAGGTVGAAVGPVGAGAGPAPGADGALLVRPDVVPGGRAAALPARRRLGRAVPRRRRRRGRGRRRVRHLASRARPG